MPTNIREEEEWVRPKGNRVGAVVVFTDGVTESQAQQLLDILAARGLIKDTHANTYDASYGGPVWYIP